MKYNVQFFPEARIIKIPFAPINIDIVYSGLRIRYFTGFRLSTDSWIYIPGAKDRKRSWISDNWDYKSQRVINDCKAFEGKHQVSAIHVNRLLNKVDGNINDDLFKTELPPTRAIVISFLNGIFSKQQRLKPGTTEDDLASKKDISFWTMYDRYTKEAKVSPARRKQIKVTMNHLNGFDAKLTFQAVTADKLRRFEKYLLTDKKPKSKNSVSGQLKKFRAFWNWAKKEITNLHYPFEGYSIDAEVYGDPIFLTKAEMDILYNAKLTDERLKRIRDIFLLQ